MLAKSVWAIATEFVSECMAGIVFSMLLDLLVRFSGHPAFTHNESLLAFFIGATSWRTR